MKKKQFIPLIRAALAEDLGKRGDVTSLAIFPKRKKATFNLIAKDTGVLCGIEPFAAVFGELDRKVKIETYFKDGDCLKKGDIVARVRGNLTAFSRESGQALTSCRICRASRPKRPSS